MADKDKRIDPFDVAALEKSLNDSATRVSTIWVSFLIFSLYLLTAAATVTQRQLFLAEPVKLPVLNIDLPLWGFFFLAPILFVILHAYVLIQVILLSRTAAAYSAAIGKVAERDNLTAEENDSLRQRLANTLFAQIFAGSPREREGAFGWLLRAMAWITLAISPILILLTFQFAFLPYHSHGVTWTHRLLILLELVVAFQLWPLVLDPQRDLWRRSWQAAIRETGGRLRGLLSGEAGAWAWRGLGRQGIALGAAATFALLSLGFASFPGEWHVNLLTGRPLDAVQCERWLYRKFGRLDLRVDRLNLLAVDIVDDEKLEKIEKATEKAGEPPFQGERTRVLYQRNLNCGNFAYADLRRVEMIGTLWRGADLQGARLHGADLTASDFQDATLHHAQLPGANLVGAHLQGAVLEHGRLQDANLTGTWLHGASLDFAALQGAILTIAELQGASFLGAQLQGASLDRAKLQGASLDAAQLQGASLESAELTGASLDRAQLQGADLTSAELALAVFSRTFIWRTRGLACGGARVVDPQPGAIINDAGRGVPTTSEEIAKLVARWLSGMPEGERRNAMSARLQQSLTVDPKNDDTAALAEAWLECAKASSTVPQKDFDESRVAMLRRLVCDDQDNGAAIAAGISASMSRTLLPRFSPELRATLALALLGEDGKGCAVAKSYSERTRKNLRDVAGPPRAPPK